MQNVRRHGSSRPQHAVRDRSPARDRGTRSRSPVPCRSRVRLTPGPHGKSDEEDDWADWMQQGRRRKDPLRQGQDDQRRPQSPSAGGGRNSTTSNSRPDNQPHAVPLIPLRVCVRLLHLSAATCLSFVLAMRLKKSPSGSMTCSTTRCPAFAALVYSEPSNLETETVYRRLMPHRASIIQDDHRVSLGPWATKVLEEIACEFDVPVDSLPEQLCIQLGVFEKCWSYIRKTSRAYHRFEPAKKDTQGNHYGIPPHRAADFPTTSALSRFCHAIGPTIRT